VILPSILAFISKPKCYTQYLLGNQSIVFFKGMCGEGRPEGFEFKGVIVYNWVL